MSNCRTVGENTACGTPIAVNIVMGMRVLENGTLLQDRFLIEDRIGVGGMGAVYLATDQKFGSRVAIKQTFYDNVELAQAFEREARLLNTLHHPVLPHVSDFFGEGGEMLLVMEYIEGEDLSEVLKRGDKIAISDVVSWTRELLDALDYLHSQEPPIIHRDIKPNNLKRTPRGNIVLLDFGLAKETSGNTLGMRSVFGYSRRYSPLEQIEGAGTDVRSDVFSLGATIFHLLTGEPPIDVLARASAIVAGRPDPLKLASDINPEVPAGFAAVIRSSLALNADDRFVSVRAMREAAEHAFNDGVISDKKDGNPRVINELSTAAVAPVSEKSDETRPVSRPLVDFANSNKTRYRLHQNIPWVKPALAAAVLLVLAGFAFTVYKSNSQQTTGSFLSPSPDVGNAVETLTPEASSSAQEPLSAGDVAIPDERVPRVSTEIEAPRDGTRTHRAGPTEPSKVTKDSPEKARADGPQTDVTRRQRSRRFDRPRSDEPPVVTIETIFTGRSASEDWRPDEISDREWKQQRRRQRRMKRAGRFPLF